MNRCAWIWLLVVLLVACSRPAAVDKSTVTVPVVSEQPAGTTAPAAFRLPAEPAPGAVTRLQLAPGAKLPEYGHFYIDLATGAVEGWQTPNGDWISSFGESQRWMVGHGLLVDRRSGKAWRYDENQVELMGAAEEHLFFVVVEPAQSRYVITNAALEVKAAFHGKAGEGRYYGDAAFSPDEARLFFVGTDGSMRLIEVSTGMETALGRAGKERPDHTARFYLSPVRAGTGIAVTTLQYIRDFRNPVSDMQLFTWTGRETRPLITIPGAVPWLSPDGKWMAYDEFVAASVPTVVVADTETGQPKAWVRSAALCYEDTGGYGNRWLADSSGLVVRTGRGYALFSPAGALRSAPALTFEPVPAPDNPNLFALRDRSVVDLSGKVLLKAPNAARSRDGEPWGATSRELMLTVPHGGHGARCDIDLLLPPKAEAAGGNRSPAQVPPVLVNTPGDCLNLRDAPGGKAIKCVVHGTRLILPLDFGFAPDNSRWLRVRTEAGDEGWVAQEFVGWGE